MPFVRTVLGDVDAAALGVTYAHEHLVIDGGRPVQLFPDFRLDSVENAVAELAPARALGLRAVVDAMPAASATTSAGQLAKRTYRPVVEQLKQFRVAELVLEFANREMTELDALPELADAGFDLAVGVVDVKSSPGVGRGRRRAGRARARGRSRGAPDARPGLRLQPDGPLGSPREAAGAGRGPRPPARPLQ